MEEFVSYRRKLDAYSQLIGEMKPIKNIGVSADQKDFNSEKVTFELVGFPDYVASQYTQKAAEEITLAKAWIGKILQYSGSANPYANEPNYKEAKDVQPTADKVDIEPWKERNNWKSKTHLDRVVTLRGLIKDALDFIQGYFFDKGKQDSSKTNEEIIKISRSIAIARTEVEVHLIEAGFQLGFELGRIRDEANQPPANYNTPLYAGVKQQ